MRKAATPLTGFGIVARKICAGPITEPFHSEYEIRLENRTRLSAQITRIISPICLQITVTPEVISCLERVAGAGDDTGM
jgi:hypothetical protein